MPAKQKQKGKKVQARRNPIALLHMQRAGWFAVMLVGLLLIQVAYNWHNGQAQILGYRTAISSDELLESNNHARQLEGLQHLRASDRLSVAAQLKADDMAAKNYWDHTAPDGKRPWEFISQVGYKYQSAGENLAYGFASSNEVISAWLNSPEHRENVLGGYSDVGFGIARSSHYQGEDTVIVVAMYGSPATGSGSVLGQRTTTGQHEKIFGAALLVNGGASWAVYASMALVVATAFGFLITHLELLRLGWYASRKFLALHPVFDIAVVIALCVVLLTAVGGYIQ